MNRLSLEPDEWNRWIYDPVHPGYNSEYAEWLREARARAISNCPKWMIDEARLNDLLKEKEK